MNVSPPGRSRLQFWFWTLLLVNLCFIIGSKIYLNPLTSGEIVRFEIAKTPGKARAIIDDWKKTEKFEKAKESIWIDYIFILLYVAGLMTAVLFISDTTHHPLLIRSGRFFRWLLPAAGICDILENIFMMQSLRGDVNPFNVMLAYDMAVAKFSVLILTFLFLIICLFFWALRKMFPAD